MLTTIIRYEEIATVRHEIYCPLSYSLTCRSKPATSNYVFNDKNIYIYIPFFPEVNVFVVGILTSNCDSDLAQLPGWITDAREVNSHFH